MKKIFIAAATCLLIASCGNNNQTNTKTETMQSDDSLFDAFKQNFVEDLWKMYPSWASSQGYHKYDSVLVIPNDESRAKEMAFCKGTSVMLKTLDLSKLSDNNKTDYYMIENQINSTEWAITDLKSYEWNPSQYNVCGEFAEMLGNNYDSLDTRLHNFYLKMQNIPAYYEAAKKQIKNPTLEHTQLAIDQNLGGASVFETDLNDALKKSHLSIQEKEQIAARAKEAIVAIKDFAAWLKALKNETPRSFRLGKELYAKKFEYDIQSGYTADEIYKKAIQHKTELHQQMFDITKQLWSKYLSDKKMPENKLEAIKMMIDKLSLHHVKADSFQTAIEHQIPLLVDFIKQKDLIYIDPSKPLVVRKEPAYMAGVAGASISAPGPYDKNGNTYYNVGSLSGWDKEKAESYLREYNHYILQILNIHEAIPGHYTQLVYANQSPSIIKSVFGNGAMIEGWAVYTERMMLENGYGNNEPEMWLMYYKWNLRTTCNTILDYGVHINNLSKDSALNLLINEAFQQKAEAEGKWKRVSVTQVQLCSYFTGYTEIYDFREELKKKMGDKFNLKQFHEKFLSYGSAPVKYIKTLMLAELEKEKK
ncbi:MAG TPA: DUF885 domain-containing protein [Bacteroidia bacterium]|jgi:uncharacterized protein (DUF885 family)|nr:DUF885 domain-containing protein [Bacteroidia bacterium]